MTQTRNPGEEAMIQTYLAPLATGYPGAFGLVDDCAAIAPPAGMDLVIKTDPVRAGVHFFADDWPEDIAWKALAVNVSDLSAKAATPLVYLAALSFPDAPGDDWMRRFADGLRAAQTAFGCHLIGGDTDRAAGPISIGITAVGTVPHGQMVRRTGAEPGDAVFVTGTIGDAALGLLVRSQAEVAQTWPIAEAARAHVLDRYLRPQPRLGLRRALLAHATAAMDLSDGLAKDFDRMCRASGVAGRIEAAAVPLSLPASAVIAADGTWHGRLLSAGDDYEILCTVPAGVASAFQAMAAADGVTVTRVGDVAAGAGAVIAGADGTPVKFARSGWDHF